MPLFAEITVQECHDLAACAGCVRRKACTAHAGRDAILYGPAHGSFIVTAGGNVLERHRSALRRGTSRRTVEEHYHFRAGAGCVGCEASRARLHNAVLRRPRNCAVIPRVLTHVRKHPSSTPRQGRPGPRCPRWKPPARRARRRSPPHRGGLCCRWPCRRRC